MHYRNLSLCALAGAASFASLALAAPLPGGLDEPVLVGDDLIYPEGAAVPRFMTPAEQAYVERFPLSGLRGFTQPSEYPSVRAVAEYEPMDAIIFAWQGQSAWTSIIVQMINRITNQGDADAIVYVDTSGAISGVRSQIAAGGADMDRVRVLARNLDSIWMRDYGPRYIYEGEVRSIVDHTYNRPRPNDNQLNVFHAQVFGHTRYEIPLVHGGGNYHLDATGAGYATRLINNENPGLTESQIINLWSDYQGLTTRLFTPFPTSIDATQHIDMWVQVVADNKVIISDWPTQSGSTQDQICDAAAVDFASRGFTVYRTPAVSSGGTHYTFTNMVMCNDIVLLPSYTNSTVMNNNFNQQALNVLQNALPDRTIIQIPCQAIVTAAGVMHCIVMHMPRHLGGENPTALVRFPNGGEELTPGEQVEIRWSTDDREGVANVDILFAADGENFSVIASATADDGSYMWTVPNVATQDARVRVVARGDDGDTGFDDSDNAFAILGDCLGDTDGNGVINFLDLNAVLATFGQSGAGLAGDVDGDGSVTFLDLNTVLSAFGTDCHG